MTSEPTTPGTLAPKGIDAIHAAKLNAVGRLTAGMAHKVNNHLTGVITFSHLMLDKPDISAVDREDLTLIIHEATQAAGLVRDLLDFAREQPVQVHPINLNDVVQMTVRMLSYQKSFGRVSIQEVLQENLPEIRGDRNQLQQVLLSILLMAFDMMPGGGKLTVRTLTAERNTLIQVSNMPEGAMPATEMLLPADASNPNLQAAVNIMKLHGGQLKMAAGDPRDPARPLAFLLVFPPLHW